LDDGLHARPPVYNVGGGSIVPGSQKEVSVGDDIPRGSAPWGVHVQPGVGQPVLEQSPQLGREGPPGARLLLRHGHIQHVGGDDQAVVVLGLLARHGRALARPCGRALESVEPATPDPQLIGETFDPNGDAKR
jgi:hypothetical protein